MDDRQIFSIVKEAAERARLRKSRFGGLTKQAKYGWETLRSATSGGMFGALNTMVPAGIGMGIGALLPTGEKDFKAARKKRAMRALIGGVSGIALRDAYNSYKAGRPFDQLPSIASMGIGAGVGALAGNTERRSRLENALRGAILGDLVLNSGAHAVSNAMAQNA